MASTSGGAVDDIADSSTSTSTPMLSINIDSEEQQSIGDGQYSHDQLMQCRQVWYATVSVDGLERLLMGTFAPVLSFVTLLINSCAIAVLLHKSFRRSPSHVVLLWIFVVDMTTAGVPLPFCIYFYSLEFYKAYLPFWSCYLRQLIMRLVPTISNTASIWLFTYLALQRYLIVCKRMEAGTSRLRGWLVSVVQRQTNRCIGIIIATAFFIHSIQLIDRYPVYLKCPSNWATYQAAMYADETSSYEAQPSPSQTSSYEETNSGPPSFISSHLIESQPSSSTTTTDPLSQDSVGTCWLGSRFNEAFPRAVSTGIYATYYVIRAIFIHLLPCCLVTFATCSLIVEIRHANRRRKSLLVRTSTAAVTLAKKASSSAKLAKPQHQMTDDSDSNNDHKKVSTSAAIAIQSPTSEQCSDVGCEFKLSETYFNNNNNNNHHNCEDEFAKQPFIASNNDCQTTNDAQRLTTTSMGSSSVGSGTNRQSTLSIANRRQGPSSSLALRMSRESSFLGLMNSFRRTATQQQQQPTDRNSVGSSVVSAAAAAQASPRESKEYSITSMLIVIMSVFLSVQLPQAFVFVWGILSGLGVVKTSEGAAYGFDLTLKILNILYLLTFPVQSSLCFIMNRPFRQSFMLMMGLHKARTNDSDNNEQATTIHRSQVIS